jgi:hypothetical protein
MTVNELCEFLKRFPGNTPVAWQFENECGTAKIIEQEDISVRKLEFDCEGFTELRGGDTEVVLIS